MKQYGTVTALNAYNVGFLAGIRSSVKQKAAPLTELSKEETEAWVDGFADGKALRNTFEAGGPVSSESTSLVM